MTIATTFKAGDPVTVSFRGREYHGSVHDLFLDDGFVRVDLGRIEDGGLGVNRFKAENIRARVAMTHRVFVYGTLKRGYGNWSRLLKDTALFVGEAVTTGRGFKMLDSGFPILRFDDAGDPVSGEIFHVDDQTLANLDCLEGVGNGFYTREVVVTDRGGVREQSYIYVGGDETSKRSWLRTIPPTNGLLVWKPAQKIFV